MPAGVADYADFLTRKHCRSDSRSSYFVQSHIVKPVGRRPDAGLELSAEKCTAINDKVGMAGREPSLSTNRLIIIEYGFSHAFFRRRRRHDLAA